MATPHISAEKGDFAKTVLMPGDPLRAKFIADTFLKDVRQVTGVRGMLGFTGTYEGRPISVMGSGMGMPSIGIYSYELYKFYDVDNIIRIGSAGSYTDKAKEIAKNRAEEILAEFNAGDKTEDSFAELAKDYSEDTGSAENGGLYDTVYKGATVEEFDKFCFEGHKKGDTAIVYGESSSYAGYHVMYYVGEGDLYSNLLAKNDLVNTTVSQWVEDQVNALTVTNGWWLRIAG